MFSQRRATSSQQQIVDSKIRKSDEIDGTSSVFDVSNAEEEYEPTVFDGLIVDCMNEILDWLPLNSLCALSKTCKSLRRTTKNYFRWKYPSEEFAVGDEFVFNAQHVECFGDGVQRLRMYDSSIEDFIFAGSNINQNLREIQFDRTFKPENDISKNHIDKLKPILENVKTVSIVDCDFTEGSSEYLIECCKNIEDFSYAINKDVKKNQFQFQKYPTLRNIEIHFNSKANVINGINAIKEQNLQLDELVLLFRKEHTNFLSDVFQELDSMYEMNFFKRLFLIFPNRSMVSKHINRIVSLHGLEGITCSYTVSSILVDHMIDIARFQNLKYLNINWLLENADQIAKELQQLIELEISAASIDAIVSFVRYSSKLSRFHIDQIRASKEKCPKFDAFILNKRRSLLEYAQKLTIYIPEEKFIKLKWASVTTDSSLVEIKREESCIPLEKSQTNLWKKAKSYKY